MLPYLHVTFAESGHQRDDVAVVGRVDVSAFDDQQLHYVQVASVAGQPQRRIALLVFDLHLCTPATSEQNFSQFGVARHF